MKNVLRLTYGLCISTLLLFGGLDSSAQNGPNLLVNADFANVTDLATNKFGTKFVWPEDWVLVSDSLLWNQYPAWKVWYKADGSPFVGSWTGKPSEGKMYQEVIGLANGTYEFTLIAAGGGANDSKYALFTTGYGGDSIAVPFFGNADWTSFSSGPINVTNGKCKVGINVKNGSAGDYIDCASLDFHSIISTGVESLALAKIRAYTANGQLKVWFDEGEILGVDIYNIAGQLVSSSRGIKSATFSKALSTKGILIVKVNTNKGIVSTKVVNQ